MTPILAIGYIFYVTTTQGLVQIGPFPTLKDCETARAEMIEQLKPFILHKERLATTYYVSACKRMGMTIDDEK